MNARQAFGAASQYGSYLRAGDPGACMYAFFFDDGRPVSGEHRAQVLAWLARPREESDAARSERLRLIAWMQTAPLRSPLQSGSVADFFDAQTHC